MRARRNLTIVACAAALSYGTLAAAAAQSIPAIPGIPGQDPAAAQGSVGTMEFSRFMGTFVVNLQGEKLGVIKDLVLDSQTGQATFVIVDTQAPGAGRSMLVVPYEALRLGFNAADNRETAVLNLRAENIRVAPQIRDNQRQLLQNPFFMQQARDFYQVKTYTAARPITAPPVAAAVPALPPCVSTSSNSDMPQDLIDFYNE
jgi:sporulation protein YlmC with PRC-barrel domain